MGLNSARDDVSEGELGDEQLEWAVHQFQACQLENRIMALHHHLIAVPYSGRQRNTLVDAGDVLEMARLCNVDLVLMGHKHVPHAYFLGNLTLLYCGTTCSEKVRADEPPCFNRIILDEDTIKVSLVNSINLEESLLLSRKRGETDFIKPRKTRIDHILQSKVFQNSP